MNCEVTVDWRFVAALGAAASGIILSVKLGADAAERVLTQVIDTCEEVAVAD